MIEIGLSCSPSKFICKNEVNGNKIWVRYSNAQQTADYFAFNTKMIKSKITGRDMVMLYLIDGCELLVDPECIVMEEDVKIVSVTTDITDWKYYDKPKGNSVLQTRYFIIPQNTEYKIIEDTFVNDYSPIYTKNME